MAYFPSYLTVGIPDLCLLSLELQVGHNAQLVFTWFLELVFNSSLLLCKHLTTEPSLQPEQQYNSK